MEIPMGHTHNADPAAGRVCSHLVTEATLASWGFAIERTDKVVGTKVIVREGWKFSAAVMEAWDAGMVRVCTPEPQVTPNSAPQSESDRQAAIAWVAAHNQNRSAA